MNVEPYVSQVQDQLFTAAQLGDERTRETAAALAAVAGPAVRWALLTAVSDAVEEVNAQLDDATASAHLDGDDLNVEVRRTEPLPDVPLDDGDASARVSLRLSESLKAQVEAAARGELISVNTWLVRAAGAALGRQRPLGGTNNNHRITGWVNG